ncbi:ATP synthase mitochondrial F1 complex assembly factor 1-like [Gigantopelta aegis]|uniref:ATP synthase mitochondrial F1 complex assembly factor 1-like n=1 Tax=Gigantopelta aegis TaxID=1735272 RepID=UPI001B88B6C5|nr:ATP synthase mitochondrial F1 complex assembly factor 1-like [Gigantopelta aegis]
MFPRLRASLPVCAQCWKRILPSCSFQATYQQRLLKYHRNQSSTDIQNERKFSFNHCLWQEQASTPSEDTKISVENNPHFIKYEKQLQQLKSTSPELYEEKLEQLKERLRPKHVNETDPKKKETDTATMRTRATSVKPKTLDSILKIDLVKDKSPAELEQLWKEYHSKKDCIYSVVKEEDYVNLITKSQIAPVFIYPLPREDGYEFLLSQISGNEVYFTPLAMYQKLKENAPPCLTLIHYTEFQKEKGIVLMNGQYDSSQLNLQEALSLVNQMALYYGPGTAKFNLVWQFNHTPDKFNYQDLIENLQNIHQLMKS